MMMLCEECDIWCLLYCKNNLKKTHRVYYLSHYLTAICIHAWLFITRHGSYRAFLCALRQLLLFYYIIQQAQCLHCQKPKVKKVWQGFCTLCMYVCSQYIISLYRDLISIMRYCYDLTRPPACILTQWVVISLWWTIISNGGSCPELGVGGTINGQNSSSSVSNSQ